MRKANITRILMLVLLLSIIAHAGVALAGAPMTGAIWTTDKDGVVVNMNHYDKKQDVYLNGGPQKNSGPLPDGFYHVQITDPSGKVVLGTSAYPGNPGPPVEVKNGVFIKTYQLWEVLVYPNNTKKKGYDDTPNNGGVYKAWLSKNPDFTPSESKTDNFKVKRHAPPQGSITVFKFHDTNGDGVYDADDGETPLANWKFTMTDGAGNEYVEYTDAFGYAVFRPLDAGTYNIKETLPNGTEYSYWEVTVPQSGEYNVTLTQGQHETVIFGNRHLGSIGGYKFQDTNKNAEHDDDEPKLGNWTINLYDDPAMETAIRTAVTGSDGSFMFIGLPEGTYYISEVQKRGWVQTLPADQGYYTVELGRGEVKTGYAFGNWKPSVIAGYKFYDINNNGDDDNEPRLRGWTIELYRDMEMTELVATAVTGKRGVFVFNGLTAGTYYMQEVLKDGWMQTAPVDNVFVVTVGFGEVKYGYAFGNRYPYQANGKTKGFWHNKNGQAAIEKLVADGKNPYGALRALGLKGNQGDEFDPADGDFEALSAFLTDSSLGYMPYILSSQLAAMQLNVLAGYVPADGYYLAPGENAGVTIQWLLNRADWLLKNNGDWSEMERIKNIIDAANNNFGEYLLYLK